MAGPRNENGATILKPVSAQPDDGDAPIFTCFLKMGLVLPMSEFFVTVMETYGLLVAQLHPNTMLTLAIFAQLCEGFIGVVPSVALFLHFFIPRVELKKPLSGGVTFHLWNGLSGEFIPTSFKSKWEEWRHDWCYVNFTDFHPCLMKPEVVVVHDDASKEVIPHDADLDVILKRIQALWERVLSGNMVATDFIWRQLALLQ